MRQPEPPHKKRKLRLSPNKSYAEIDIIPYSYQVEFAFLSNAYGKNTVIQEHIHYIKQKIPIILHIKLIWHNYYST